MGIFIRIHVRVSGEMQSRMLNHQFVKDAVFGDVTEIELNDDVSIQAATTFASDLRTVLVEVKQPS